MASSRDHRPATAGVGQADSSDATENMMEVESVSGVTERSAEGLAHLNEMRGGHKGLLARMPPHLRDACIERMRVFHFNAGQSIIEQSTIGTTMVGVLIFDTVPSPLLCTVRMGLAHKAYIHMQVQVSITS